MSKQANTTNKPITSLKDLAAWIEGGSTPREKLVIGSEHEKFVFDRAQNTAAIYQGKHGLETFLKSLAEKNSQWAPQYEDSRLVELTKPQTTESVSLEPSGQLEHATDIFMNIHDIARNIESQISESVQVADSLDQDLIGLGYHPVQTIDNLPRIPKTRYQNFDRLMQGTDGQQKNGLQVLYSTASTQANIGFEDERDMVKKLRVSLALQPVVTALFANSPFKAGKLSGMKSTRSDVIHNAVNGRYGFMLPVAFEEGFGFERYADYALNEMPMMGVYHEGHFVDTKGAKFSDMLDGKIDDCCDREPTLNDWEDHLNCIWPEVRVRRFLEMRGADSGPEEMIKALPALWTGLMYDPAALDEAYEMIRHWSSEDREYLRNTAPGQGLETPFMGTTLQEIAKNMLALAQKGLNHRAINNAQGDNEAKYLDPLFEIANSGQTWADRLIYQFENNWKGDLKPLFNAMSYKNKPSVLNVSVVSNAPKNNNPAP